MQTRAAIQKKRLACKQSSKFVMRQQTMDLLLKFSINLIQHLEAKKMISYYDLIAIVENCFRD